MLYFFCWFLNFQSVKWFLFFLLLDRELSPATTGKALFIASSVCLSVCLFLFLCLFLFTYLFICVCLIIVLVRKSIFVVQLFIYVYLFYLSFCLLSPSSTSSITGYFKIIFLSHTMFLQSIKSQNSSPSHLVIVCFFPFCISLSLSVCLSLAFFE